MAIIMERSPAMVTCVMGAVRSGAAYVPIDPAYPAARVDLLLGETAPAAAITELPWIVSHGAALDNREIRTFLPAPGRGTIVNEHLTGD